MTDKKQRFLLLFLLTLFLGGCSLFTDKAAERREMIQIAESTKMERAIKHLLISIDPKAFTSEGVIPNQILQNLFKCTDEAKLSSSANSFRFTSLVIRRCLIYSAFCRCIH